MDLTRKHLALIALITLYLALCYATLFSSERTVRAITNEDGIFEYLGAVGLIVAGILFSMAYVRSRTAENRAALERPARLFLLALGALFVFGAGEEISWGQRLLGLETPEGLAAANRQHEINFHNLHFVYASNFQLFQLFWFTFVLAVPLLAALDGRAHRLLRRIVPIIPIPLGLLFLLNYVLGQATLIVVPALSDHLPRSLLNAARIEIQETNLSVLAALTAWYVFRLMLEPPRAKRLTDRWRGARRPAGSPR